MFLEYRTVLFLNLGFRATFNFLIFVHTCWKTCSKFTVQGSRLQLCNAQQQIEIVQETFVEKRVVVYGFTLVLGLAQHPCCRCKGLRYTILFKFFSCMHKRL